MPKSIAKNFVVVNFAVFLALSLFYFSLKTLTLTAPLAYYDEGETLYHALSLLSGKIPYRDHMSHHFLGYAVPIALLGKLSGFSIYLMQEAAFLNQVFTGFFLFLTLRFFTGAGPAFLGALITVGAREPWVLALFQQYQTNLLVVIIWYLCAAYIFRGNLFYLFSAAVTAGVVSTFDQRVVFVFTLPLAAYFIGIRTLGMKALAGLLASAAAAPVLALFYLSYHGALGELIEQCFVFPFFYRSASHSSSDFFRGVFSLHAHLWNQTPLLFLTGLFGAIYLFRKRHETGYLFLILAGIVQAIQPFFGGREYDYYTIPWLPWLAAASVLAAGFFSTQLKKWYYLCLVIPLLSSQLSTVLNSPLTNDDGARETADYLKLNLTADAKLYVWGYRLDIYARLKTLAAYPFANYLFFQPDHAISDGAEGKAHVHPEYLTRFRGALDNDPADYLVVFQRDNFILKSDAADYLQHKIDTIYELVFEIRRSDFLGKRCHFRIFKLKPVL